MKIISMCSMKGGVGKSTVVFHMGWGLYELGYRVLLIDLDPQGNVSLAFGRNSCSSLNIFAEKPSIQNELVAGEGGNAVLGLVTSDFSLEHVKEPKTGEYGKLKKAISGIKETWDYILIDCPPAFGLFTRNAFMASDYLVILSVPLYFSLAGIRNVIRVAQGMKEEGVNKSLEVLGIVINSFERHLIVHREAMEVLDKNFPRVVFETKIPKTIRIEEALQNNTPIWVYESKNPASAAFKNLATEFVDRIQEVRHGEEKAPHERTL